MPADLLELSEYNQYGDVLEGYLTLNPLDNGDKDIFQGYIIFTPKLDIKPIRFSGMESIEDFKKIDSKYIQVDRPKAFDTVTPCNWHNWKKSSLLEDLKKYPDLQFPPPIAAVPPSAVMGGKRSCRRRKKRKQTRSRRNRRRQTSERRFW